MLRIVVVLALLGTAVPAASCRPPAVGSINHQGYRHEKYEYRVAPKVVSAAETSLMGPDWLLDNYYLKKGRFLEKTTNAYMERLVIDGDNDGKWEFNKDVPAYDLRFLHRNRDAVIWLRTIPLSGWEKDKDLAVLAQMCVESVAGGGYERVRIHPKTVIVEEKRFAAVATKRGVGRVADTEAFFIHVDVANIDQLRVQPDAYKARVEFVLLKPELTHSVDREDGSKMELPVLMVAGYKNTPDAFEQDLPAFREFLNRVEVKGKQGLSAPVLQATTPAVVAPATPAAAPAPATPLPPGGVPAPPAPPSAPPIAPPPAPPTSASAPPMPTAAAPAWSSRALARAR